MIKRPRKKVVFLRILLISATVFCAAGYFFVTRSILSADNSILPLASPEKAPAKSPTPVPLNSPTLKPISQTQVYRIKATLRETRDITVMEKAVSLVVVSPEIASAVIKQGNIFTVTGLKIGETILLASNGASRQTYIIEVSGKPLPSRRESAISDDLVENHNHASGTYSAFYAQGFKNSPSLLRQSINFRRKLSKDQTLRIVGEMFNLVGNSNRNQAIASVQNFGVNRLAVGLDSPGKTIDFLDSEVYLSPLTLNNYTIRGFHLVTTRKAAPDSGVGPQKGIEIFAGFARPSFSFFDREGGAVIGAMLPVASGKAWQVRAGFITISQQKDNRVGRGGTIAQVQASYTPNSKMSADAEMNYANGAVSWRARFDIKLREYGGYGEITRLDQDSPVNGIRAQSGGRRTEALTFYWRPLSRINTSIAYQHTDITRVVNSGLADFERSVFSINANYRLNKSSRINLRFSDQQIETRIPGSTETFNIQTRTVTVGHSIRFDRNWANTFEARMIASREDRSDAGLDNGFNFAERLRYSWNRNSVTAFANYTYKTPSLTSLIVRNPALLPPALQQAYLLDPAQFLQTYRDQLAILLPGVDLPQTRNFDAGARFQTTFSRFAVTGEGRYNAGEILSNDQKNLYLAMGVNMRLDAANSVQVNGWQSFGSSGQSAIAFSYTHRFGAGSGGGFQFTKLFGLSRGKIKGRVYYDLNGNGQADENEPGVAGVMVQLDEDRSVKTDATGRYEISANEGKYTVGLASEELGRRMKASTATQQRVPLYAGRTANVDFGLMDFGYIGGRVFNDSAPSRNTRFDLSGLRGVRLILKQSVTGNIITAIFTDGAGAYEFANIRPGDYVIDIDQATLPPNYRIPDQLSWPIRVVALQGTSFDIPLAAQRAISGVVFIDKDGDAKFDPQKDEAVAGAVISANGKLTISDVNGNYILRNLDAGKITLIARPHLGRESSPLTIDLGVEPNTKRGADIVIRR